MQLKVRKGPFFCNYPLTDDDSWDVSSHIWALSEATKM